MARTRLRRSGPARVLVVLIWLGGGIAVFEAFSPVSSGVLAWVTLAALGSGGAWGLMRVSGRIRRRIAADEKARLYQASSLAAADAMSGAQFERYVADLLRCDGYRDVVIVGGPGDGGADILAVDPGGRPMAVQCKRQVASVSVQVVRQLLGTLSCEHPGRTGLLVTTALVTKPAKDLAIRAGIRVVGRYELARWMNRTRDRLVWQADSAAR